MEDGRIVYRDYGIADRFQDGTIEMNRNLDKYPALKQSILKHEREHTNNPKFNKKDFVHDISTINQYKMWDMIKFIFWHPKSLVQFLPLYKTKKRGWILDVNLAIIWGVLLLVSTISIIIGFLL